MKSIKQILLLFSFILITGILSHTQAQKIDIRDYYVTGYIKDWQNPSNVIGYIMVFADSATIYTIDGPERLPYTRTNLSGSAFEININNGDYILTLDPKNYVDHLSCVKAPQGTYGRYMREDFTADKIPPKNELAGTLWKGARQSGGKDVEKETYYAFGRDKYVRYKKGEEKRVEDASAVSYELIGNVAFFRKTWGHNELGLLGPYGFYVVSKLYTRNKTVFFYTLLEKQ